MAKVTIRYILDILEAIKASSIWFSRSALKFISEKLGFSRND